MGGAVGMTGITWMCLLQGVLFVRWSEDAAARNDMNGCLAAVTQEAGTSLRVARKLLMKAAVTAGLNVC